MSNIKNISQVNKGDVIYVKGEGNDYKACKVSMIVDKPAIKYIVTDDGVAYFIKDGLYKAN